jgi:hypothetical protein
MRYAFLGTVAAATGYTETVWSGTNATDPGGGSDTRQPIGFDEMQVWYTNFRVNKASIEIQHTLTSSSATPTATAIGGDVCLYANESSSALTLQASAISQPGAKFSRLVLGKVTTLKLSGSSKSVIGIPHAGNDNYIGTTASGPASFNWYFHAGRSCDVAYTGISIEYTLRITYNITFYNRKLIELPTFEALRREFLLSSCHKWIASGKSAFSESEERKSTPPESVETKESKSEITPSKSPSLENKGESWLIVSQNSLKSLLK